MLTYRQFARRAASAQQSNKMPAWPHAVESIGTPGLHLHDLRKEGSDQYERSRELTVRKQRGVPVHPHRLVT
jgi:hypothetical protein